MAAETQPQPGPVAGDQLAPAAPSTAANPTRPSGAIDARGPRFAAVVTTFVLALAVITDSVWILLAQTIVFAIGAGLGVKSAPYGWIFSVAVRPRLAPPSHWEAPEPPRFAQTVGLVVAGLGVALSFAGLASAVPIFGGLALIAAFLNGAFGICLGCEMYLLIARLRSGARSA
jgi:hypothetical protein